MLHIVPQKRPLAAQILCHPWMLQQPPPQIRATDVSGVAQPHQEETAAALRGAVAATFRGKCHNVDSQMVFLSHVKR